MEPRELSVRDALDRMRKGELKAEDLVLSCLERIRMRESTIHAWAEVAEEQALIEARQCDDAFRAGEWKGVLHGIPIGVKDIIDVRGMWTRAGCSAYPARVAESDAEAVRQLRNAGAIVLGKTETTAFANNDPAITRNPWNTEHTPGGSSSGSGAAVPDRMCLAAIGTQTGGSVLRPSAYNGIVGFKPTYATVSLEGIIPVSWTLDHVGTLCRNVEDTVMVHSVIRDANPQPFARMPAVEKTDAGPAPRKPFRFGYFRSFIEREAENTVKNHIESLIEEIQRAGATVMNIEFSNALTRAAQAHRIIMDAEMAAYHREFFASNGENYPPNIKARIEQGLTTPGYQYIEAIRQRIEYQRELSAVLSKVDALLLPSAPSTAPRGLLSTGSPVFCVPMSMAGFPAISIPTELDDQNLPLAVQIAAGPFQEEKLLAVASWCEELFPFDFRPA